MPAAQKKVSSSETQECNVYLGVAAMVNTVQHGVVGGGQVPGGGRATPPREGRAPRLWNGIFHSQ